MFTDEPYKTGELPMLAIWNNAHIGSPEVPPPEEHGRKLFINRVLGFYRVSGEIMPQILIDLLECNDES